MKRVRYTLLGDGSSDRSLMHVIRWALHRHEVEIEQASWADFTMLRDPPRTLAERVREALYQYPCDLLFVHRDAEASPYAVRRDEVSMATQAVEIRHVAVIPVRMTEAWLLHDEPAIRLASGNPRGRAPLELPPSRSVEQLPDPKHVLSTALLAATELSGRRMAGKRRELPIMRARVAELIEDFSPLCGVPAFDAFLAALSSAVGH